MNVMETIRKRRSIRSYEDRPVEEEKLNAVLEAGRLAPSASNRQEWRFVVARDPDTRQRLMRAARGQRFVGQAGRLLDRMILAMGLDRGQVYIANVVKCRPPGNRDPHADEAAACQPYLHRQIGLIRPRVIVGLGGTAMEGLLVTDIATAQELLGQPHTLTRIDLILDGGTCPGGIASTIVDLTVTPPAILRTGDITPSEIADLL